MKKHWRQLLSLAPRPVQRSVFKRYFETDHSKWIGEGMPLPVSHFSKHQALIQLSKQYQLKTLVETGTYLGDTLFALYEHFDKLYSIELSPFYYQNALKRFKAFKKIELRLGDSAIEMSAVISELKQPALFWLDGHYSGGKTAKGSKECPVYDELVAIFSANLPHVIVIDDARLFVGENDYPTIEDLKHFVTQHRPGYSFLIENDSIRLLPVRHGSLNDD